MKSKRKVSLITTSPNAVRINRHISEQQYIGIQSSTRIIKQSQR